MAINVTEPVGLANPNPSAITPVKSDPIQSPSETNKPPIATQSDSVSVRESVQSQELTSDELQTALSKLEAALTDSNVKLGLNQSCC